MTDPTFSTEARERKGAIKSFPMDLAAQVLYIGQLICNDTTGYAVKAADTASFTFIGIAQEQEGTGPLNNGGAVDAANGDSNIKVYTEGDFVLAQDGNVAITNVGDTVYVIDSGSVGVTGNSTNKIAVGMVIQFISSSFLVVRINPDKRESVATLTASLASVANAEGASLIGVEDAAANFAATTVEDALAEILSDLALTTASNGASLIGIQDAGSFTTAATVEAALAELYQNSISVLKRLYPVSMTLEDGTALLIQTAAPVPGWEQIANEELVLSWATHANPGNLGLRFSIPDDVDVTANLTLVLVGTPSAANDSPVFEIEYYNMAIGDAVNADTAVTGESGEFTNNTTIEQKTFSIIAANIAADSILTVIINPKDGELGNDSFYLYDVYLTYTSKIRAS